MDQNKVTAGVVLAFDTIDHQILYYKLERYGIRGVALQWIKSYFDNWKQFVQYKQCFIFGKNHYLRCTTRLYITTIVFYLLY